MPSAVMTIMTAGVSVLFWAFKGKGVEKNRANEELKITKE
jgi:hypothetical protein